jgi:steroid delta-isomerase-like uncharacterized protein
MSVEENKAIVHRFMEEVVREGNLAIANEIFTADFVGHYGLPESPKRGPEAMIQRFTMLRTAFPDVQYTVEDEIAEGDKVVHRLIGHGTQQGEFLGIPPTGKQATWTGIAIYRIAGGKIAERWVNVDNLGTIQQLGAILSLG